MAQFGIQGESVVIALKKEDGKLEVLARIAPPRGETSAAKAWLN
jgi:hypothetical protein